DDDARAELLILLLDLRALFLHGLARQALEVHDDVGARRRHRADHLAALRVRDARNEKQKKPEKPHQYFTTSTLGKMSSSNCGMRPSSRFTVYSALMMTEVPSSRRSPPVTRMRSLM